MKFSWENAQIDTGHFEKGRDVLASYRERLLSIVSKNYKDTDEASLLLPDDKELKERIRSVLADTNALQHILVIGIGGSNLGAMALYEGLRLTHPKIRTIRYLDTNDHEELRNLRGFLGELSDISDVLIFIITKSGTTTETIANAEITLAALKERFEDIHNRIVIISDVDSLLSKSARQKGIRVLGIPSSVGGRYSVFSSVGLAPLYSAGVDIDALQEGAHAMRDRCLEDSPENPALVSAIVLYEHYKLGWRIHDSFFFHPELEGIGKWYRQLMGESLGKERDSEGAMVHAGITPLVSIGSTDLHSMGQLYLGGPKDKVTTFIRASFVDGIHIPSDRYFPGVVPMIDGRHTGEIMSAIFEGTKQAYSEHHLPFMEVMLNDLSAYELASFMQFKMIETMYLAKLMNVNAFDQPSVESYKEATRMILENRK